MVALSIHRAQHGCELTTQHTRDTVHRCLRGGDFGAVFRFRVTECFVGGTVPSNSRLVVKDDCPHE